MMLFNPSYFVFLVNPESSSLSIVRIMRVKSTEQTFKSVQKFSLCMYLFFLLKNKYIHTFLLKLQLDHFVDFIGL